MKLLVTFILFTVSLLAATSTSDRNRITELELKSEIQDRSNSVHLELHEKTNETNRNQNDSIAKLLDQVTSLEKRIKILEKRIK